ncbi:ATP-binding protein [Lentibacillus sediminis]|uniref:ATP-binding protein n=1 Tax=Lentibacillus sediminis TaxID=1940529 RepID=UPI001EFEA78E|nr:ATP-binding protein [Lentibacillus sediminis]
MGSDELEQNKNQAAVLSDVIKEQRMLTDLASLPPHMLTWIGNNQNDIIIVWDQEGQALYISDTIQRILGYAPADFISLNWYELIPPEDIARIKKSLGQNVNMSQEFSLRILNEQGKYIDSECTIALMQDKTSGQLFYISIIKDVSAQAETNEMMIHYEKMSVAGQLAAGIAHEIRNPLTSMKGFLQLLEAGIKGSEEYYKIMLDEIEKMETITSELLFISKPLTEHFTRQSLEEMVHDVKVLLHQQAKANDIDIDTEGIKDGYVYGDRTQIKQVLINLIKNAIESMEETGKVIIRAKTLEKSVELEIIDEGAGIPADIINKLGEPFFTTKQNGTGLGVMITRQILDRHNAVMEIFQNEVKGSTFRISFPLPENK